MIDPAPYARASCSPTEPVPPEPPRIKTVFPVNVAFNSEPYHANALYDVSATLYVSACGVVCVCVVVGVDRKFDQGMEEGRETIECESV
jgi:hypothetical protein